MTHGFTLSDTTFDEYSAAYDDALNRGLRFSGESKNYFARCRIDWLRTCLARLGAPAEHLLDFGCGVGTAVPFLLALSPTASLVGLDVSDKSLTVARALCAAPRARFGLLNDEAPMSDRDVAFCNGVFHHVPVAERANAVRYVYQSLKLGGLFSLWENNPWNPGTRLVMSRIPFDRDAIPLSPPETRRLVEEAGFEVLRVDFLFFFPRPLKALRFLEPHLMGFPLGAQYQVLGRKTG